MHPTSNYFTTCYCDHGVRHNGEFFLTVDSNQNALKPPIMKQHEYLLQNSTFTQTRASYAYMLHLELKISFFFLNYMLEAPPTNEQLPFSPAHHFKSCHPSVVYSTCSTLATHPGTVFSIKSTYK